MESRIQYFRQRIIKELDTYFKIPEERLQDYQISYPLFDYTDESIKLSKLMDFFVKVLKSLYHKTIEINFGWNDFGYYPEEKLKDFRILENEYNNWVKPALYSRKELIFPKNQEKIEKKEKIIPLDYKSEEFLNFLNEKIKEIDLSFVKFFEKGGSAALYLVFDNSIDDLRLLKVYTSAEEAIRKKYLKYDKICTDLDHPNVNKIQRTGTWTFSNKVYRWSIQNYLHPNYESLQSIDQNAFRSMKREDRLKLFGQLLEALSAIREKLHIHNDLHPGNILINAVQILLKVIDPGFSHLERYEIDHDLDDLKILMSEYFFTRKEINMAEIKELLSAESFTELKSLFFNNMQFEIPLDLSQSESKHLQNYQIENGSKEKKEIQQAFQKFLVFCNKFAFAKKKEKKTKENYDEIRVFLIFLKNHAQILPKWFNLYLEIKNFKQIEKGSFIKPEYNRYSLIYPPLNYEQDRFEIWIDFQPNSIDWDIILIKNGIQKKNMISSWIFDFLETIGEQVKSICEVDVKIKEIISKFNETTQEVIEFYKNNLSFNETISKVINNSIQREMFLSRGIIFQSVGVPPQFSIKIKESNRNVILRSPNIEKSGDSQSLEYSLDILKKTMQEQAEKVKTNPNQYKRKIRTKIEDLNLFISKANPSLAELNRKGWIEYLSFIISDSIEKGDWNFIYSIESLDFIDLSHFLTIVGEKQNFTIKTPELNLNAVYKNHQWDFMTTIKSQCKFFPLSDSIHGNSQDLGKYFKLLIEKCQKHIFLPIYINGGIFFLTDVFNKNKHKILNGENF
jgi:hypothetical protein